MQGVDFMKNAFKKSSMLLLLLAVAFTLASCGKSKEEKEAEKQAKELAAYLEQEAKDIEAISDIRVPNYVYDETTGLTYDASLIDFDDHEVEYDTEFSADAIRIAQDGLALIRIAACQRVEYEELSKYFTDWACAVQERYYGPTLLSNGEVVNTFDETFEEIDVELPTTEILKTFVRDDCIEIVYEDEFHTYQQCFVYFKNGKIDNIENGEWFMYKEELVEAYGDIFD